MIRKSNKIDQWDGEYEEPAGTVQDGYAQAPLTHGWYMTPSGRVERPNTEDDFWYEGVECH